MSLSIGAKSSGTMIMKPFSASSSKTEQQIEKNAEKMSKNQKPSTIQNPEASTSTPLPEETPLNFVEEEEEPSNTMSSEENTNKDKAKNIEIRRMSATEDGDKVLESAWDSPEKEKEGKTPLEMVQSMMSQIEDTKLTQDSYPPPAWTQGGQRPLLHSQKQVANQTPPSSAPLPNMVPPQQRPTVSQNVTVMAPQMVTVSTGQQQFMQLVNTINGPMLMQAMPSPSIHQPQEGQGGRGSKKTSPTHLAYPQQNIMPAGSGGQMPILVSPTLVGGQPSPTGMPQQHVLFGHPSPGSGVMQGTPQFLLNQPTMIAPNQVFLSSNGTLVAMPSAPAMQGVVYNQLPDGSLVQVQSPLIHHHQHGQAILTSNGSYVFNNGGQQVSPNGSQLQFQSPGGTYFMTPAGLVQTAPHTSQASQMPQLMPMSSAAVSAPGATTLLEPQPGTSGERSFRKESTDKSEDSDENDTEHDDEDSQEVKFLTYGEEEEDSSDDNDDDDDDDDDDEETPLAKKKSSPAKEKDSKIKQSSPKTYIQSNEVDSSGLQATPPHAADDSDKLNSPEMVSTSSMRDDLLDTSGSTDGGASTSSGSPTKRRRKRNADELIKEDGNNDSDGKHNLLDIIYQYSMCHFITEESVAGSPETTNRQFSVGELVWGPHGTFPSWPGKLVRFERDGSKVLVCWFGNRDTSQVNPHYLKSLSDGLEAHHRERKKLRK
jgi:hypothetical protein